MIIAPNCYECIKDQSTIFYVWSNAQIQCKAAQQLIS